MTHRLTLKDRSHVTHDTLHLTFDRPEGLDWVPGQATSLRVDKEGWRDEDRPFTFTSFPDEPDLHFVIKIYPDHDGVTEQIGAMAPGDTVLISDPWGKIQDKGPGVFIAAGAGITPFIPILRAQNADGRVKDSVLIFTNERARDIILREEFEAMAGLTRLFTLTDESVPGLMHEKVDGAFLDRHLEGFDRTFYVCGPHPFQREMIAILGERGVAEDRIVTDE